ncbi:Transposase (fragment) [Mycobacterium tuberculosis]
MAGLHELMNQVRGCFARIEPWVQAREYVRAVSSDLPERNGWTIAEWIGDRTPDKTQRLLNHAVWDTSAVMAHVRCYSVAGLDRAADDAGRGRLLRIGALDETGQEKKGQATAGVKRQHMGCAGGVDNGINTVHLAYVRQQVGHALIGCRQWIPAEHLTDPRTAARMGLPAGLGFATKGQLAVQVLEDEDAAHDEVIMDFVAGDEVYGHSPDLRTHCEDTGQGYILRVRSTFTVALGGNSTLTCKKVVQTMLWPHERWQIVSAGPGDKGARDYAWRGRPPPHQCTGC